MNEVEGHIIKILWSEPLESNLKKLSVGLVVEDINKREETKISGYMNIEPYPSVNDYIIAVRTRDKFKDTILCSYIGMKSKKENVKSSGVEKIENDVNHLALKPVEIKLSHNQQEAFNYITMNLPIEKVILLQGSAGTGKSTLTKNICNYYRENKNQMVCAIAPTHKSKKIIKNILNKDSFIPVSSLTIASILGKIREHSYVGTKTYSSGNNKKLSMYSLFIIDEVSMIQDEDLRLIVEYVRKMKKQLLVIGDSNQIPCPTAKYVVTNVVEKADSYIFTDETITKLTLTEIVRQAEHSPIIRLASYIRDHLHDDLSFREIAMATEFTNCIRYENAYDLFRDLYRKDEVNSCRIIAYTNASVKTHNMEIRMSLDYDDEFVVGELMTGYNNIGWPELIIENGEDYYITRIQKTNIYIIGGFSGLVGRIIDLEICDVKVVVKNLFFININHPSNLQFINRLIELGEILNSTHSTKNDYKNYMELKNSVIFTEDIYKYDGRIFTESTFKETHSLLFTNINEIIVDNAVKNNALSKKINTTYTDIIDERIKDVNKVFGDSETFADRYKVIEKDIYYGYGITAHKSQGSTYQNVIFDETDFQKITNRWNFKYGKLESRIKEKNQLRYVGYTRAKEKLFVICDL